MNLEYFQALEEKVNTLINRIASLRNENKEIAMSNRNLEEKIQNLLSEVDHLRRENEKLTAQARELSSGSVPEEEIKSRIEEILRKVDEVVEA